MAQPSQQTSESMNAPDILRQLMTFYDVIDINNSKQEIIQKLSMLSMQHQMQRMKQMIHQFGVSHLI